MPTVFTHAILAGAVAVALAERSVRPRLVAAAALVSALPDADVIGFRFGVNYGDFLGHRGFCHSPFFGLVLAFVCMPWLVRGHGLFSRKWWGGWALLAVLSLSHGFLDALTDGGLGIALLAPFDNSRYFLPWRPIPVAPIGVLAGLGPWGLDVIFWEVKHLWLPVLAVLAAVAFLRRARARHAPR
ncbi:MAG: metal-dependent hydrolase [Planctomycetes bacterium]|nr:metal-dependent hydrolase [Planctomycetota bacterium]